MRKHWKLTCCSDQKIRSSKDFEMLKKEVIRMEINVRELGASEKPGVDVDPGDPDGAKPSNSDVR